MMLLMSWQTALVRPKQWGFRVSSQAYQDNPKVVDLRVLTNEGPA